MLIATSLAFCKGRYDETDAIAAIAAAGFDAIDFNFCDQMDRINWHDAGEADRYVDGLAQAAQRHELKWVQSHGPMCLMFSDDPQHVHRRSLIEPCMRACSRLGIPWMVLHGSSLPGAFDRAHQQAVLQRNVEAFRQLLPLCEKYNVGIAIENGADSVRKYGGAALRHFLSVPENLCDLVDALDHPHIGVCWDTGHAHLQMLEQCGCLCALGYRLKALHIAENNGMVDMHMMPYAPGAVGVDWQAVIEGLRQIRFAGPFVYEAHNSLRCVPDELMPAALQYYAQIARYMAQRIAPTT